MKPLAINSIRSQPRRSGYALPMIGCGVMVALAITGWALESLWLRNAREELQVTAEAAALAAARQLATDETLKAYPNWGLIRSDARRYAAEVAINNHVRGDGVFVEPNDGSDVLIGSHTRAGFGFGREDNSVPPDYVRVFARRTREHNSPVPLIAGGLVGKASIDMLGVADAEVNRHVVGLAPTDRIAIPAYAMAIRQSDADGRFDNDWQSAVIDRNGTDQFGWDPYNDRLLYRGDGIPEVRLFVGRDAEPNVVSLLFRGVESESPTVAALSPVPEGLWPAELQTFGGRLMFEPRDPRLDAVRISSNPARRLRDNVVPGQSRIAFLFLGDPGAETVQLSRMVAIRVLKTTQTSAGWECIAQPTVIATPTAILAEDEQAAAHNPYICRVHLTHPEH